MKLIEQSVELVEQESYDLDGIFKIIERAARTCYASEPSSKTPEEFVNTLTKSGHLTPLEFGTVCLKYDLSKPINYADFMFFHHNPYSKVEHSPDNTIYYVTTNYRVIVENNIDLQYLDTEPDWNFYHRRFAFDITAAIGISRELNRYRTHN